MDAGLRVCVEDMSVTELVLVPVARLHARTSGRLRTTAGRAAGLGVEQKKPTLTMVGRRVGIPNTQAAQPVEALRARQAPTTSTLSNWSSSRFGIDHGASSPAAFGFVTCATDT